MALPWVSLFQMLLEHSDIDNFKTQLCGGSGRSADLATLVLTNLKANTNQITDAALNKQMGKMDLGNDDDEDNPNVDTSEAGQRKKVQAEQDGLIKMIEQKLESMDLDG